MGGRASAGGGSRFHGHLIQVQSNQPGHAGRQLGKVLRERGGGGVIELVRQASREFSQRHHLFLLLLEADVSPHAVRHLGNEPLAHFETDGQHFLEVALAKAKYAGRLERDGVARIVGHPRERKHAGDLAPPGRRPPISS